MKFIFTTIALVITITLFSQENTKKDTIQLHEVLLHATRASDKTPVSYSNITKQELERKNLGQDLPILLNQMPSVVTTSDAGAGVGYTGIRVRGSDATRVNVTINGIPFNDSESQGSYWVDLPDLSSSVEDIQLQRGVGTSTNGSSAFGASLNVQTKKLSKKGFATTSHTVGSYNTRKHNISIGSGMHNNFYAEGRLSKIVSDGYIDRASSDLSSYFTEAGYISKKTQIKAMLFGGKEITYQSWYGTPKAVVEGDKEGIQNFIDRNYIDGVAAENLLNDGRTYNHYTYDNQVDNYTQTHYQVHFTHQFRDNISGNISGNYTHGKGYYEQFKDGEDVKDYFPTHPDGNEEGDVIRRKWLDNDFYAVVYSLNYQKEKIQLNFGGSYTKYDGDHFGKVIWDSFPVNIPINSTYYFNEGNKKDFSSYVKGTYTHNKWVAFADLQLRNVTYKATGITDDFVLVNVDEKFTFINPKLGLTYKLDNYSNLYTSFSVANREPNRDDLVKTPIKPKAENLQDIEIGYRVKTKKYYLNANFYYMNYKDQLVLTGELDNVGGAIRQNVAKSFRSGLELAFGMQLNSTFRWDANLTLSQNKIDSFDYVVYDTQYDVNWDTVSYEPVKTKFTDTDISFSPNIIIGNTLTYTPVKNLDLGFISKYVGKQYLDNTSSDSKSMDAYFVNNLSASFKLHPKWIKEIHINLLVNNIFSSKYVSNGYTYSYYYRPQGSTDNAITEVFYYPQATINFLTGVTLKF